MNVDIVKMIGNSDLTDQLLENHANLNHEFHQNAKIRGLVSVIYYPGQNYTPLGHARLAIEGDCYVNKSHNMKKIEPLERSLERARAGRTPFIMTEIIVTPKQLAQLKKDTTEFQFAISCMHGVSRALGRGADFHIPRGLNVSPLLSSIYLQGSKTLGNKQISKIELQGSLFQRHQNYRVVLMGIVGEIALLYFVAVMLNTLRLDPLSALTLSSGPAMMLFSFLAKKKVDLFSEPNQPKKLQTAPKPEM